MLKNRFFNVLMLLKYLTLQRLNLNKGELQMNIQEERDALFDEHFKPKSQNIERIKKFCQEIIHTDIKKMLQNLKFMDYQLIVITDGKRGAYAYDGHKYYYCPTYNEFDVVSTLGAGDAFASTLCGALNRTDMNIGKSLMYASVNSGSVVSQFGATEGLLTFEEIEKHLKNNPNYTYLEC